MDAKVTVAIPTYSNRAHLLEQAIRSVLDQTLDQVEVFVSNDGSTDNTLNVTSTFDDSRLHYVELPAPGGLHANLNACLRLGTAPYVAICQDDDLWFPDNLARLVAVLDSSPRVVLAHGAFRWIDATGRTLREWSAWEGYRQDAVETGEEFILRSMAAINRVNMSSALIRRGALGDASFREADGPLCDAGMWLRVARHGDVAFLSEPLTALRVHAGAASVTNGLNESDSRVTTMFEIELAQDVKKRFLREYGYSRTDYRRHRSASRRWIKAELLRAVTRLTSPTRSPKATVGWLARAARIEPALITTGRAWRVLGASLAGRRLRGLVSRRREEGHLGERGGSYPEAEP